MKESLDLDILPDEMQKYARKRTYIEADNLEVFRRKLLFAMPETPLKILKPENNNNEEIPALFKILLPYTGRQDAKKEESVELSDIKNVVKPEKVHRNELRSDP